VQDHKEKIAELTTATKEFGDKLSSSQAAIKQVCLHALFALQILHAFE
jgi:hypothetical protein